MSNRLANETSPYLLQHRENPVDWYPWGPEALARAQEEDKPILVSIGYSACHWCHVMAHESFEDPHIAAYLNAHFVNIKVDREERPDIDSIYMSAVQAMSGQGGWPLNAFLTPEGVPFFGGTYWPPQDRMGMPGFLKVLTTIAEAWTHDRDGIVQNAEQLHAYLLASSESVPESGTLNSALATQALALMEKQYDSQNGGFGNAPKFPQASTFEFLLRHHKRTGSEPALTMALTSLDRIAAGGINDQLAGGFARYSVDRIWLVPHFEKMLYDNGQLMSLYLDAWRITKEPHYREVVESIADWTINEMTSPEGAFYASLDADSEGVEGKFYVWTDEEIDSALTPDFTVEEIDLVKLHWGITAGGNFDGANVLSIVRPVSELAEHTGQSLAEIEAIIRRARVALLKIRAVRVRPGRDEKIIASWNGLMLKAFAASGSALHRPDLIAIAERNAAFLLENLRDDRGRLARTWRDGVLRGRGGLDDYAYVADGLVALYSATGSIRWLDAAGDVIDIIVNSFAHPSGAGFFDTADDHEQLITRPRDLQDGATPSGNAVAIDLLLMFGILRSDDDLISLAKRSLASMATPMGEHPIFMGRYLAALERWLSPRRDLVLSGNREAEAFTALQDMVAMRYEPLLITGFDHEDESIAARYPMLANRPAVGEAAAYLCEHATCLPPVTTPDDLAWLLNGGDPTPIRHVR